MSNDDHENGPKELHEAELEAVQGGSGVWFGDYAVLSPGVQIVLDGRAISFPSS